SSARSGSTQAPESRRLPVSLIMDVGSRDLCAQGLTAVMTGVQCEDMEVRRHDEMILMSQKQRVQIVDQLSAGGNGDFLRISIENVEGQRRRQSIAHGNLLPEDMRWIQ